MELLNSEYSIEGAISVQVDLTQVVRKYQPVICIKLLITMGIHSFKMVSVKNAIGLRRDRVLESKQY